MEASGSLDRERANRELFSEEFLIRRPLLQALDHNGKPPVLLIDEIDRAGRGIRRIPVGAALGLPGDDPRARYRSRHYPTDCHRDLQPYPRAARRAQAPLSLLLDRLPGFQQGAPNCHHEGPRRGRRAGSPSRSLDSSGSCGPPTSTRWPASRRRSTGSPPWWRLEKSELDAATIDETLGIVLKNQEDIEAVRGERTRAMLNRSDARRGEPAALELGGLFLRQPCCTSPGY